MADEDFEIDIYGSAENDAQDEPQNQEANAQAYDSNASITIANGSNDSSHTQTNSQVDYEAEGQEGQEEMETTRDETPAKSQQPQQGVKRKESSDNRPIDPGATNCLMVSELNWWQTDDDIRKWVVQASCEEELKDITFSEHKVNGKSKGLAYLDFTSQQAATATKHQIDVSEPHAGSKRPTVIYSTPNNNPFRTLPKDAPARGNREQPSVRGGANTGTYNDRGGSYSGGYRGRGNYNNNNNGPRGGFNRNFSAGNPGNMGGGGGFNNNNNMGGGGFNNPMGGGGFNGGFNRGGMMGGGMRGGPNGMRGRGGMNMMGMNNMGNMPMGMPGNMGMGMMGGGMPGFNAMQPHFNPAFFGGNQSGGNEWQNPHGAKRPRGE